MCEPVSMAIMAAAAAAGTGASIAQGAAAQRQQKRAAKQAEKTAQAQAADNDRAINRANQKSPNMLGIMASNRMMNGGGIGSTMLTGPAGALRTGLTLGRPSLLGG